jgi:putative intracellular protease/amidase
VIKRILIPLPDTDFDLTEVAVPWKLFSDKYHKVVFATENGNRAFCDPKLITGVIFGQLGASREAIEFYRELEKQRVFLYPIRYDEINPVDFDLLVLPGGHAPGMRQYLENTLLQQKVLQFFKLNKLVGSICHGAIVLARTIDPDTGKSIIHKRKLTGLTWKLERLAYWLTAWKLGRYYRTYPKYVQDEVKEALSKSSNFKTGGRQFKPFVCVDGNLVTARWPKDAYLFAETLIKILQNREPWSL